MALHGYLAALPRHGSTGDAFRVAGEDGHDDLGGIALAVGVEAGAARLSISSTALGSAGRR
ncbi:hypothetical protein NRF20_45285 [Streptomyces sp. R-74717]|uniref:hypothetical protein n=1 Tax=Streptomyces TaxID=1883 RepID=UPI0037B3551A